MKAKISTPTAHLSCLLWGLLFSLNLFPTQCLGDGSSPDSPSYVSPGSLISQLPPVLPARWLNSFSDPEPNFRPLQILHSVPAQMANTQSLTSLQNIGLGGVVINVDFSDYLLSQKNWQIFEQALKAAHQVGLRVWIYDEQGYPSGAAGGLVLKEHPDLEALALTYNPSHNPSFQLRPAYERTHASNNYHAAQRYPNLIDSHAVRCFLEKTHDAYWHHAHQWFGNTIEALFTDEPSLMAVNTGPLPSQARDRVRIIDPLNNDLLPLPSVPWIKDLPQLYRNRYKQDIMAHRSSLFTGQDQYDIQVRQQFWALIADLMAQRYFGQIQDWAHTHHIASSGHTLYEESLLFQVPLYGNALKAMLRLDIPGMDMLSSDPQVIIYSGGITAQLPASAALFNGTRKVMTEVSDFHQWMNHKKRASLAEMCATAAWQAALGVTEFTLYYDYRNRQPNDYRAYCDFVGRLNSILRPARLAPKVLLYYPIYDIWGQYLPTAQKLSPQSQTKKLRDIQNSFFQLCRQMTTNQISFTLIDHELLAAAKISPDGIKINNHQFKALVLPAEVQLPPSAAEVVKRFETAGGKVLRAQSPQSQLDFAALNNLYSSGKLDTPNDKIIVGRFVREDRNILIVVNVGPIDFADNLTLDNQLNWLAAHPDTGKIDLVKPLEMGKIKLALPARSTLILIGSP